MYFSLVLENENGERLDMTATANQYMPSKIEGLNPPAGTISTSSYAGMNGSYLNNAFIEKRNVVISFAMRGIGIEKRRHQLYRVVKPSRYIKIWYKTANIDVYAEGYVETCEVSNFEQQISGQISILCPDIYWYSRDIFYAYYSGITGAFHFPFPESDAPFPLGVYSNSSLFSIINDGDETGFTLKIEALPSDIPQEVVAVTPTIYNENGEYLQIKGDILTGDVITVTTKTGNKTVTLTRNGVDSNILNRLVSGSTWLTLKEGTNIFRVEAVRGVKKLRVTLMHRNSYLGVCKLQLEIYSLTALKDQISVSLEAICDSYSSLLWDIEFYQCGCFEVYIAASPQNVSIFQRGRIVARSDDAQHFGIIESLQLETDAEKGDYLTVTGRFLACLLERRIIYPTITANGSYEDIVRKVLSRNVISAGIRNLPGFSMGTVSGDCWQKTARMQVSYDNILEWLYSLCETIGGSANVRLDGNALKCELFSGTDRSLLQDDNPHIVFSDAYNNLLSFSYAADDAVQKNFAYVLGCGEGSARKRTTFCSGAEPTYLDRYEVYVDERNTAQEEDVTDAEYLEILKSSGAEHLVQPKTASESAIAAFSTQYQYNKDYFVGDYVTVEQKRFGLIQPRIQLIGMVESFDQNGRSLTPTFKETE